MGPKKTELSRSDFFVLFLSTDKGPEYRGRKYHFKSLHYHWNITRLINCETHNKKESTGKVKICDDFQIVTPEGYTLLSDELKEQVSKIIEMHKKDAVCKAPICAGKCDFSEPTNDSAVRRHIVNDILAMTYYCVKCGKPAKGKTDLQDHSYRCPFKVRVSMENIPLREQTPEEEDIQKTKKQKVEHPKPTPIVAKIDEKFIDFLNLAFDHFRNKKLITVKTFGEFRKQIERNFDYNFFVLFRDFIAPAAYASKIYRLDDTGTYYGIYLCNKLQNLCTDPRKSIKFRILEKRGSNYTSIYTLTTIRSNIMKNNEKTCSYDGCSCKNSFATDDPKNLVGHVLEKNFLIVCEGCRKGISDWNYFIEHFTQECFIERPAPKD